ncbi:MAG: ATP-binding cassette domain-containing protein [Prolixibacteraceae bacterium]|nr:ATP-binding cassette domain-containing protein [Prolixibacteraceae bacterium]
MYEGIIETLIKLFAILTDLSDQYSIDKSGALVESYLKENFSNELAERYKQKYQENVRFFHVDNRDLIYQSEGQGEAKINHKLLDEICASSVELYNLESRYMIIVQLLNFIHRPDEINNYDLRIVNNVSRGLKIDPEEYENLVNFYLYSIDKVQNKNYLFIVNGNEKYHDPEIKHLYREHMQVELELIRINSINTFFFKYWGPRNMYLNGHRLVQQRLYVFPQGGILRTSRIIPIYYSSILSRFIQEKGKPRIVMNVENVEYRFSRKVYGLHPVSFQERSGDLVGILGGSGVGKTTLLNVLCGKQKPNSGRITINGFDLYNPKNKERLKGVIGYVTQDEFLLEELTVYQNLDFNARFCFGDKDEKEISQIVEQSLIDFDLVEARDLVVGNPMKKFLSGGQRKRLNIALELMREPSVLLVDEPTSGLSSADSEKIMYLLKMQCLKGKLVFANIHQPGSDIYKLFDRLIVLDKGGRVVFFGNPIEAVTYFKTEANYVNPDESECPTCGNVKTEQPLKIIGERMVDAFGKSIRRRKISPEDWYERYKAKVEPRVVDFMNNNPIGEEVFPEAIYKKPGWIKQLRLFFKRDLAKKLANKQYLSLALFESPVLALILGFFSKYSPSGTYSFANNDNIPSFLFMSMVVALFVGLSLSAEEIFKDRKILKREQFLNLSRGAYFSSKISLLFIISAIQAISFILVGNYMLEIKGLTFSTWIILFSTACVANLLGLNLSAGLNSIVSIYIAIPLLLVPLMLFGGLIVDFNKMHPTMNSHNRTPLIGDLMASRWAYEALAVDRFKNNEFQKEVFELEKKKNEYSFKTFYWVPEVQKQIDYYSHYSREGMKEKALEYLPVIETSFNELTESFTQGPDSISKYISALDTLPFNIHTLDTLSSILEKAGGYYRRSYDQVINELDDKFRLMADRFGSNEELYNYKNRYTNKKLESLVRGAFSFSRMQIIDNHIVQTDDYIYMDPLNHNGRAHFYAPVKFIGKIKFGTVFFNVIVLWIFTVVLMVALYFDMLRKTLSYFESWRLLRLAKKRDRIFENPMAFIKEKKEK